MADTLTDSPNAVEVSITYRGAVHKLFLRQSATITDLAEEIATSLSVPISNQKIMVSKLGLLKLPFKDPSLPLSDLLDKKITLLGSTATEVSAVNKAAIEASKRSSRVTNAGKKATAYKRHDWAKEQDEAIYTFTTLRPLPFLPNPEGSLAFLQRLKDDPGIKATMRKHKWTVPLLTEMNPIEHTQSNHEGTSRTLGLNRNSGEVIELRLRTDEYDGYRDYKNVRKTLCHELAHNVHGPHDRKFWDLCRQIEKEVEGADWRSGGRALSNEEFFDPGDEVDDHGGWHGGEFVLGGEGAGSKQGLSRREILAMAAEERTRKSKEQRDSHGEDSRNDPR